MGGFVSQVFGGGGGGGGGSAPSSAPQVQQASAAPKVQAAPPVVAAPMTPYSAVGGGRGASILTSQSGTREVPTTKKVLLGS